MYTSPCRTVRCSSMGCWCGGIMVPGSSRMRSTKGLPAWLGSPKTGSASVVMGLSGKRITPTGALPVWTNAGNVASTSAKSVSAALFIGHPRLEHLIRRGFVDGSRGDHVAFRVCPNHEVIPLKHEHHHEGA